MNDQLYYSNVRFEIEPLLPDNAERILEIGCGAGGTLGWLKQRWPQVKTFGIDGCADLQEGLAHTCDEVRIIDLNKGLPDIGKFDLILALDVLEHLLEPEQVLADLVNRLTDDGVIIVSVPNVARLSVSLPLLLGRFQYSDMGILDRTHLRFFTQDSATAMMRSAGLQVIAGVRTGLRVGKWRLLNILSAGRIQKLLATQFVMRGQAASGANQALRWHY